MAFVSAKLVLAIKCDSGVYGCEEHVLCVCVLGFCMRDYAFFFGGPGGGDDAVDGPEYIYIHNTRYIYRDLSVIGIWCGGDADLLRAHAVRI